MHLCFQVWFQVLWWTLCNDYWKCRYDATIAFVLGNKQVLYDFVQNECNIPYDVFIYRLYFFLSWFLLRCMWKMKSRLSVPLIVFPVYELSTKAFFKKKNTVIKRSSLNFPSISICICADSSIITFELFAVSMFGFRFFAAVKIWTWLSSRERT